MREFTKEQTLLATLKGKFASQFAKRFGDMEPQMVEMIIKGALLSINDEQFQQGINRLLAPGNKFMPDLSEFQNWCVSGSWWSEETAWLAACRFTTLKKVKTIEFGGVQVCKDITDLAKKALDQVNHLITDCRMKEAERQFKSVYCELISKAQQRGQVQEWYVPPVMIEAPKVMEPKQIELSDEGKRIGDLTAEFMKQGMKWGDAFQQAQLEIRGYEKPLFGGVLARVGGGV